MAASLSRVAVFRQAIEALGRFATAQARRWGNGSIYPLWQVRAEVCETCTMRVVRCGVSYCGKPYLQQVSRDPAVDGCGCPCRDKARSANEHCPIDRKYEAAVPLRRDCTCKWCMRISEVLVPAVPQPQPGTPVPLRIPARPSQPSRKAA